MADKVKEAILLVGDLRIVLHDVGFHFPDEALDTRGRLKPGNHKSTEGQFTAASMEVWKRT